MKKILSLLVLTGTFGLLKAQQISPKIACVSLQEVIISMPEAKKADTLLQAFQKDLEGTYVEMVKEYQQKDSIFRTDSAKWSANTRKFKREDLARLVQQLQSWQQSVEPQLQRKQQELFAPIRVKALDAIEKVAKRNGYTQVVEKGVLYFYQNGDDILNLVKQELVKDRKSVATKTNSNTQSGKAAGSKAPVRSSKK